MQSSAPHCRRGPVLLSRIVDREKLTCGRDSFYLEKLLDVLHVRKHHRAHTQGILELSGPQNIGLQESWFWSDLVPPFLLSWLTGCS